MTWHLVKIPKIAHFFYGGRQVSYLHYLTIQSFLKYNPDWDIRFYYPIKSNDITWESFEQKYPFVGDDYKNNILELPIMINKIDFEEIGFSNEASAVHQSDFLRLRLLSSAGGLWSDMDIFYVKPMEALAFNIKNNEHIDTCMSVCNYGHSIGFMMASKENPIFSHLLDKALKYFNDKQYQSIGSQMYNKELKDLEGFRYLNKTFKVNTLNIPMSTVYPYDALNIPKIFKRNLSTCLQDDSIGIHWYAGHTEAGKFLSDTFGGVSASDDSLIGRLLSDYHNNIFDHVNALFSEQETILDIGCGNKEIHQYISCDNITTLDVFESYNPDVLWDLNNLPLPFKDNQFSTVLAFDVIEHLEKDRGFELLSELKRVCSKQILLLTPLWWDRNKVDLLDYKDNPYNEHKSLWSKEDFPFWRAIPKSGIFANYFLGRWEKKVPVVAGIKRFDNKKIFVVGAYGNGKTTFARDYAYQYGNRYIDFDRNFSYKIVDDLKFLNILPKDNPFVVDGIPFDKTNSYENFVSYALSEKPIIICVCFTDKIQAMNQMWAKQLTHYAVMQYTLLYNFGINKLLDLDIHFYDCSHQEFISYKEFKERISWTFDLFQFIPDSLKDFYM